MYSPFLWRNTKGQSKSIIKRRWRWRSLKLCQLCAQSMNLIEHVHQNLSMSRLNSQDMIQRTLNVWIIRSSRWMNISISISSSTRRLSSISTCRRGKRGNNTRRCTSSWTGSPEGKSARPRNNKILWMKIGWISACSTAELLWTSFKERRNRWTKLIDAPDIKVYKNTHRFRGMVWRWEIGYKEWHATLRKR